MCALKLDDLFDKKKEAPQVLDLSRSVITSEEELRRLMEKVPEYKIRPEKVRPEDVKMREKDFTFHVRRKELKRQHEYSYANPCPLEMRSVKLEDLSSVAIEWKMLTSLRPKTKQDEDMFTRLVYMSKMQLRTAAAAKKGAAAEAATLIRRGKNRAGILETKVVACKDCGEEFCAGGTCGKFLYENFTRVDVPEPGTGAGAKDRGRAKSSKKKPGRKARSRKRSGSGKRRSKNKSKSQGKRRSSSRSPSRSPSKSPKKPAARAPAKPPPKTGSRSASESPSRTPAKGQSTSVTTKKDTSDPSKDATPKPTKGSNKRTVIIK